MLTQILSDAISYFPAFLSIHLKYFLNRLFQWVVTEEACGMFSLVVVPLYETLGTDSCEFIIKQSK